ncbi:MAG: gamma carbonic anhydrase family protein [Rickettsia endosymbiont of Ixodes persulcatus]|nr:gamma carbonic anhydrase family protein [Rickettsia endosymbiont of Ixodes persulcatus]MCZ6908388.1 gamma carbonic anhydrase family protein [Rickettsia endosymbiont of Ixodes persulcatus]MCZ6909998.1 gamma carbonic anhydrase family protein [Rickettsia endosymbiont of Ixodes persulcatus]MCZ6914387.1 gamma carbonic anhydrase family protein [Rickettsia endosymbiont of Ixodes persulcatus]MCZ6918990.1 gamma carbonic anhydrase family protein [Rickettsia endosymbiont of Ixodes persulcatus]
MYIIPYKGITPKIDKSAYIAESSSLIGDVEIGSNSSIWFNTVLRGDVESIKIGNNTNVQDGSVIHTSRFNGPIEIGDNITIGHLSLIHACTIHNNAFIGMHTTIMDYAVIEEYAFIAAGSLIPPKKIIKSKELWIGCPAKFVRYLTGQDLEYMQDNVRNYVELSNIYNSEV